MSSNYEKGCQQIVLQRKGMFTGCSAGDVIWEVLMNHMANRNLNFKCILHIISTLPSCLEPNNYKQLFVYYHHKMIGSHLKIETCILHTHTHTQMKVIQELQVQPIQPKFGCFTVTKAALCGACIKSLDWFTPNFLRDSRFLLEAGIKFLKLTRILDKGTR